MVEGCGAALFPVVFFDGERDINIGNVGIYPSLDFKTFQSILSRKIGISSNQITIYLVDGKKPKFSPEDRRKIPITSKVSFAVLSRQTDCFFLVVLKRSRRDRSRKPKPSDVEFGEYCPENRFSPENMLFLRRNQAEMENPQLSGFASPYGNQIAASEFVNYNERMQSLQIQRENYMAMISNSNTGFGPGPGSFPSIEESYAKRTNNRTLCEECTNEMMNANPASFHCCLYDPVTAGFRSPAGPISRPFKAFR